MHKLVLLFLTPPDLDEFEHRWSHDFVPQAEKMPGLQRVSVSRIQGALSQASDVYLLHELYFKDRRALDTAMASPQGQSTGRLLMEIAGSQVEVLLAEHQEDRPQAGPTAS